MGKEKLPQVVYTTEEWKQLKEYAKMRDLAVKDDRIAARLQSTRVVAGAEQKEAQAKVDAFQTRRHFWKFHVEGFGKLSLREVEQKIKTDTEEKFKLYNFLRPTKREAIQLKIEFLQETKKRSTETDRCGRAPSSEHPCGVTAQVPDCFKACRVRRESPCSTGQGDAPARL